MSHRYKVGQIVEASVVGREIDTAHEIVRLMPADLSGVPHYRIRGTMTGVERHIREDDIGHREFPTTRTPAHAVRQARIRGMAVRAAGDISQAKGSDAAPSAAVNTRPTVELSSGAEARHLSALEAGAIRRALRQLQLATDPSKFELAADTLRRLDPRNPALLSLSEKAQQLRQGACSEDPD